MIEETKGHGLQIVMISNVTYNVLMVNIMFDSIISWIFIL